MQIFHVKNKVRCNTSGFTSKLRDVVVYVHMYCDVNTCVSVMEFRENFAKLFLKVKVNLKQFSLTRSILEDICIYIVKKSIVLYLELLSYSCVLCVSFEKKTLISAHIKMYPNFYVKYFMICLPIYLQCCSI